MKYGLFWVVMGPFGLGFGLYGSELVWKPIGPHLDSIWVTYGPVLVHFCVFGLLLDYCWLAPIVALVLPYCCPIAYCIGYPQPASASAPESLLQPLAKSGYRTKDNTQ